MSQLKKSAAYKASDALKAMSARQLERFLAVFNAAYNRVTERGGDPEEAERTAFAIAFSTARRMSASLGREMENVAHFFAPMAPQQFGGNPEKGIRGYVFDFSWIQENPDLASLATAGNEFNYDHDQTHTALGQIRGLILREHAPAAVRKKVHKDIPFLLVASYYKDADEELREIPTISAEWDSLSEEDGIEMPLPLSFAVTRTPLNGPNLGVERVASLKLTPAQMEASLAHTSGRTQSEIVKKRIGGLNEQRRPMPRTPVPKPEVEEENDLQEQVASLQTKLAEQEKTISAFASLQKTVEGVKGLEPLAQAFASLAKPEGKPEDAIRESQAALKLLAEERKKDQEAIAGLQKKFDALVTERKTEKATEFAAGLVKEGRIPADAQTEWASLWMEKPETAASLAGKLPKVTLGAGGGKATNPKPLDANEASAMLSLVDERMAPKPQGGGA